MAVLPDEMKAQCSVEVMNQLLPHNGKQVRVGGQPAILDVNAWKLMSDIKEQGYVKADFRYATPSQAVPADIQGIIDTLAFAPI